MSYSIPSLKDFQGNLIYKSASESTIRTAPVITVVTVCFNPLKAGREKLFSQNLDSVQMQKGVVLEHLIIDGASIDGTLEFLKSYNNKYHDIRILSKADSGIYEAMNRGIVLAQGKYVIFLNSDDYYHHPDGLAISQKALENTNCSFTFAPIAPQGEHTRFTHYSHPQRRLHKLFVTSVIPHPSMLYRRSALMEIGGYDQTYRIAADYDMTLRLIIAGHKGCYVNHCFVTFVMGGLSTQDENKELDIREKTCLVKNAHYKAFGFKLSGQEAEYIVLKGYYPRKYLSVYVASQKFVSHAFCGLPKSIAYQIMRCFNYVKYYLMCLLAN